MAGEALEKLEEQLKCSICLHTYTDPKQLQCHHVFCQQCLVPLVVRDGRGRRSLTCPNCRHVTSTPDNGVAGLQSAFHITPLLEIRESLKKLDTSAATPESDVSLKTKTHCLQHSKRAPDIYCKTCEELVCTQCILVGGKHHAHKYFSIENAFDKLREEMASIIEPMEQEVAAIQQALVQLNKSSDGICDQRTTTEDKIHVAFQQLRETLDVRETELIAKLNQVTEGKMKSLATQRDEIETILAQRNSYLYFLRESLATDDKLHLLKTKGTVKKIRELSPFKLHAWKPSVHANTHVGFAPVAADMALKMACQNYGDIVTTDLPDPSHSYVSGDGLKEAVVGKKSTIHLVTNNFARQLATKPFKSLECRLISELLGNCCVERSGLRSYDISYQPLIKGRHQLIVKADGQHVPGSPFSIVVTSPVENLGTLMHTISGVKKPQGIAINQVGEVVVTEGEARRVSVFTPGGVKLRSFGEGQLVDPGGVTVDDEGNIVVVDMGKHCILKFTKEGQFVKSVGTGSGPVLFSSPTDVAFNKSYNRFYVLDRGSSCIQVLNSDLTFYKSFGEAGRGVGDFSEKVWGIACNALGYVYVADTGRNRVHVFSAEGRVLRMFGSRGWGLHMPGGICHGGDDGGVYVSENCYGSNRISLFTWEGHHLKSFKSRESSSPLFDELFDDYTPQENTFVPSGLAVDVDGLVYVCDCVNDCVQIF